MLNLSNIRPDRFSFIDEYLGFNHREVFSVASGVYLAGGSLRTLISDDAIDDIHDIDLFFKNVVAAALVENFLEEHGYTVVFRCPAGELTTLKNSDNSKIQLITKRYYTNLIELVSSFDIHACCAGWDGVSLVLPRDFIYGVRKKEITLQEVTYPVATIKRIIKYSNYGYYMRPEELADLVEQINRMTLNVKNMSFYVD